MELQSTSLGHNRKDSYCPLTGHGQLATVPIRYLPMF